MGNCSILLPTIKYYSCPLTVPEFLFISDISKYTIKLFHVLFSFIYHSYIHCCPCESNFIARGREVIYTVQYNWYHYTVYYLHSCALLPVSSLFLFPSLLHSCLSSPSLLFFHISPLKVQTAIHQYKRKGPESRNTAIRYLGFLWRIRTISYAYPKLC